MICFLDARLKTKAFDQTTAVEAMTARGQRGMPRTGQQAARDCMPHMPHATTGQQDARTLAAIYITVCIRIAECHT